MHIDTCGAELAIELKIDVIIKLFINLNNMDNGYLKIIVR